MSNFEEKYLKALRSIEEILKANRQIKDELDVLRSMRQAEIESCTNVQKEQFRIAYDALLQDKSSLAIRNQTLELDNQRLKLAQSQFETQLADAHKNVTSSDSPIKPESREAELRNKIKNYEEHHANLLKNGRRLQERNGQLQGKLLAIEKSWRSRLQAKDLEIVEVKARARREYGQQLNALRKDNASLKLAYSVIQSKLENSQQAAVFGTQLQAQDWEGALFRQLTAVRSSLDPLRQQVSQLQQADQFQREGDVRQRASLQARVLQLQADGQKNAEVIRSLEKRILEGQQAQTYKNTLSQQIRRLEEQNQLLNGRIIVMQSREITLRSRTGEQLQERVLQFESRIDLLLNNKEGLRELREVGIHQLIALKAYILQLDSRLKELMQSNGYILKKYKSYKQKYQNSLKENKQQAMTINTLKMKIMGYDQLVLKLQVELEAALKVEHVHQQKNQRSEEDLYRRKYQLLLQKLQFQQKYKQQQLQTLKIGYETRIVQLTIKAEQVRSLKETIVLYKKRNQQLQNQLSRKDDEISESKVLTQSKVANEQEVPKQSRDMITSLHSTIKAHEQTISRLQTQLRNKQQSNRRNIRKLEKQVEDAKEQHSRDLRRKDLDFSLNLDQQIKKYKLRVAELENANQFGINLPQEKGDGDSKIRISQKRLQSAEAAAEQQVFNRRRLEKQLLDITQDYQQLQRNHSELEIKLNQFRSLQRNYEDLKGREGERKPSGEYFDYQLQSKDAIIKRLNNQIQELKQSLSVRSSTPISQKNQVFYLKQQIEQLKDALARQNRDNSSFKTTIQTSKKNLNSQLQTALQEKEALISRLRRDLTLKQNKVMEFEEQASQLTQQIRRFKRELTEIDRLRNQISRLETALLEKQRIIHQLRAQEGSYDVQLDRIKQELVFVKQNYQRINYQSLEKTDQISKLTLEIKAAATRTANQLNTQYAQEIEERERQYDRLSKEVSAIRGTIRTLEQQCIYHEQNQRKANNGIVSLRFQNEQLKEQNEALRNQLYSMTKQVGQMRSTLTSYKRQADQQRQRQSQNYHIKTEFFTLKSDVSNLNQQLFTKQSMMARMNNQVSFLKHNNSQMEEELYSLRQYNNRITFEYNTLRQQHNQLATKIEQKDESIQRVNVEISSLRRQKQQLEDDIEYMNNNFTIISEQLNKAKGNIIFYQEEIQSKTRQSSRMLSQIQNLRSESINLNQQINEKQAEINKLRQQLFNVRFQTNQHDYEQKLRIDRQIYAYKSKISQLQRDVDERDAQIKRLQKNTYRPQSPNKDFQLQELRIQLERTHNQVLSLRKQNNQYRYEQQRLNEFVNSQQRQIVEISKKFHNQRQQIERQRQEVTILESKSSRQRQTLMQELSAYRQQAGSLQNIQKQLSLATGQLIAKDQQIINLSKDIQAKNHHLLQINQETEHYRQQLLLLQNHLNQRAQQINKNTEQHYKMIIIELQNKLNTHVSQLKHYQPVIQQYKHRIDHQSHQLQQLVRTKDSYQATIQNIQLKHSQEISQLRSQITSQAITSAYPSISGPQIKPHTQSIEIETIQEDHYLLIHPYLEEIDRLNNIIRNLQQDLAAFKLKLSSMIVHENKIQKNLNVMMRLFNEVTSVGQSIEIRQAQIGEVRKSFEKRADSESGRSSLGQQMASSRQIQLGRSGRSSLQSSSVQGGQQQSRSGMISIKISATSQQDLPVHHPPGQTYLHGRPIQQQQSQFIRQVRNIQQHSVQSHYISHGQSNIVRHQQNIVSGASFNDNGTVRRY